MEPITFAAFPPFRVTRRGIVPPMDLWNLGVMPAAIIAGWVSVVLGTAWATPLSGWVEGHSLGPPLLLLFAGGGGLLACFLWIDRHRRMAVRADPSGLRVGNRFFPWASIRCRVEEMELLTDTGEPHFQRRERVLLIETSHGLQALLPRKAIHTSLLDRIARLSVERSDSPADVPRALGALTAAR